ncbi:TIGR02680 family protein [Nocardia rhamnosiphila]
MTTISVKHFDQRWRLSRAGVVNVWHYLDNEFLISGGRLVLRGANGSGKSRALEMLLPFLLDADRRRMDATGSQKVSLDELMRTGARGQTNRIGYLWLELTRPGEYLTLGAHIKYSASAHRSEVRFFTTGLRVGEELPLLGANRDPLPRDRLGETIGQHRLTDAEQHREAVRTRVFGLHGEAGRDRFTGLVQLLHTLRSPDVGNRIDEGKLPQILSDALPPLSEHTLEAAGDRLDGLVETRAAQEKLVETLGHVRRFHGVYSAYAAGTLTRTATALRDAAKNLESARKDRHDLAVRLDSARDEQADAANKAAELKDAAGELRTAIDGMRQRPLFREAADLAQMGTTVKALLGTAEQALSNARRARADEAAAADNADVQVAELQSAVTAAGELLSRAVARLTVEDISASRLPATIAMHTGPDHTVVDSVQDSLDQVPVAIERPRSAVIQIVPEALDDTVAAARDCARAAEERATKAERREAEARRLASQYKQVESLERASEDRQRVADGARTRAEEAATGRDELAVASNRSWREWLDSDTTRTHLGQTDRANPTIEALDSDIEILCGDDPRTDLLLDDLDQLAAHLAVPALDRLAGDTARTEREIDAEKSTAVELDSRRRELEAEQDPEPPTAPWQTPSSGVPLWRVIDFRPDLPDTDRAGIEGALLAAGLLTATLDELGDLRSADGETVLSTGDTPVDSPLSRVLRADPSVGDPAAVDRLLSSIGWQEDRAAASIGPAGHWRNGALRGHHLPAAAQHIGAAARAAARREALATIAAQLNHIAETVAAHESHLHDLRARRGAVDAHLRTAPKSRSLTERRATARVEQKQAEETNAQARAAAERARAERTDWSERNREHRGLCEAMALPAGAEDLREVQRRCGQARSACLELVQLCGSVTGAAEKLRGARDEFLRLRERRADDEATAESARQEWHRQASQLAALHDALDLPLRELTAQIRESEDELRRTDRRWRDAEAKARSSETEAARIQVRLEAAFDEERSSTANLHEAGELFNNRLRLPGLQASATSVHLEPVHGSTDPDNARSAAERVLRALHDAKSHDVNRLLTALTKFGAETSGQLEVQHHIEHDVHLIHLEGAEDHHNLPAVLAYLEARVEQGRHALTEREREVFTEFVLGNVTDELRRRVQQARHLVQAMSTSLAGTRTSHGIGVRIGWELDSTDPELQRLMQLVGIADQVRSEQDSEELVGLVRERVERLHTADAAGGYTAHLREALDYRAWHTVEVTILGPDPGQARRISRRAKISQGETRFVSYVSLFAAADGYLSGLPDADHALRLVLLDDAFAKVDQKAIGELMGLLVRMDIDFVMTGHALWGTVPEVPSLDIYEIRRVGDSSVVPTRIHWDGHRRNYLVSVQPR